MKRELGLVGSFTFSQCKRGISAIVATVMLVLISAVAVAIIYGVILPMFSDISEFEYADLDLGIALDGYTVYDTETGYAFIQIRRGNDDLELAGLKIIFEVEGVSDDSTSYKVPAEDVPGPNQKKTYVFDLRGKGILGEPNSVSVIPIIRKKDGVIEGGVTSRVLVPKNSLSLTDVEKDAAEEEAEKYEPIGYWTELVDCLILDEVGGRYKVEASFNVTLGDIPDGATSCFDITANDVVLDFDNYLINGTGAFIAVNATGVEKFEVRRGKISNFLHAVYFNDVTDSEIADLEIREMTDNSVYLIDSYDNLLTDLDIYGYVGYLANRKDDGIELSQSHSNVLEDIYVEGAGDEGVEVERSDFNNLSDIEVINSLGNGIKIGGLNYDRSSFNRLESASVLGSSGDCIEVEYAESNIFDDLDLRDCTSDGLKFYIANKNNVSNLFASGNAGQGIQLEYSNNNFLESFELDGDYLFMRQSNENDLDNFEISGAYYAILSNQYSSYNTYTNFNVSSSNVVLMVGEEDKGGTTNYFINGSLNSGSYGVYLYSSSGNYFENLDFVDISFMGFYIRKKTSKNNHFDDIAICGSQSPSNLFRCPSPSNPSQYFAGTYTYCSNSGAQSSVFTGTCD